MSLRDICGRLRGDGTVGNFRGSWPVLYSQLLVACQQAIADKDAVGVADCLARLRSGTRLRGISETQGAWIKACLSVWLHCTHLAVLLADYSSRDMAVLLQPAWEAIQAAQRLYRPGSEASTPCLQDIRQRLDHWPSLAVDTVLTALASESTPVSYVRDVTRHLCGQEHVADSSLQVTVLFTQNRIGLVGRLVMERLSNGQGDLFPHPRQMGSVLDERFIEATRYARCCIQAQGLWPPHTDVRWWVAQWHERTPWPTFELLGDSLGGAFAVGLGCLFQQRPVDALYAITAAVTPTGALRGIGELPAKLRAASEAGIAQVIVARDQDFTGVDPAYWSWQVPETGVVVLHRQ
jgi:hypothetical protein